MSEDSALHRFVKEDPIYQSQSPLKTTQSLDESDQKDHFRKKTYGGAQLGFWNFFVRESYATHPKNPQKKSNTQVKMMLCLQQS